MTTFIVNEDTDFTPSSLKCYLNNKFKNKKSGELFNYQDIQQYTIRGKLPDVYGGAIIEVITKPTMGSTKILRLKERNGSKQGEVL